MTAPPVVDPYAVDEDNPEWTEEDFARARPGREVFAELGMTPPRPVEPMTVRRFVTLPLELDLDPYQALHARGLDVHAEVNRLLREALLPSAPSAP